MSSLAHRDMDSRRAVLCAICRMAEGARGHVISITVRKVKRYIASTAVITGGSVMTALREVLEQLPADAWRQDHNSKTHIYIVDVEALRKLCRDVSCNNPVLNKRLEKRRYGLRARGRA
jgi:hypothetical protein